MLGLPFHQAKPTTLASWALGHLFRYCGEAWRKSMGGPSMEPLDTLIPFTKRFGSPTMGSPVQTLGVLVMTFRGLSALLMAESSHVMP